MNSSVSSWRGHLPASLVQRGHSPAQAGFLLQLSAQQQFTTSYDERVRIRGASIGVPQGASSYESSRPVGTFNAKQSEDGTTARPPVNVDQVRAKAEASRLVAAEPPLQSNANISARDPSPLFRSSKKRDPSRFWIPDPPHGPTYDWVNWVRSYASDSMPPSVITKALRCLTQSSTGPGVEQYLDNAEASPDVVLDAVHSLLKLCVAHADANPEMVLEQVSRSQFLRARLPEHPACYNAVLMLFNRAASAPRTFSDPLSVSQLAVSQVRLRCVAPLFWQQLSGPHIAHVDIYPTPQIVNLVWAAAKLDVQVPEQLMHKLHGAVLQVLPNCNDRNIASLAWAFAKNSTLRYAKEKPSSVFNATAASSGESSSPGAQPQTSRGPTQQFPDASSEASGGASWWLADPARALSSFAVPSSWASHANDLPTGTESTQPDTVPVMSSSLLDSESPSEAGMVLLQFGAAVALLYCGIEKCMY